MGAKKADDMTKCTHLVAGKGILRTVKFMAAVASGVQIVTPEWIKACLKAHSFVGSSENFRSCLTPLDRAALFL